MAPQLKSRTKTIIQRLKRYYPHAHCALQFTSPLELLVATVLSAQCTDERVNKVTPELFRCHKNAKDYAAAELPQLEQHINSTGFFRAKAKALQGIGKELVAKHNGEVPRDFAALVKLPGVGRKTANVVMGNAFHEASGIVVDTHVKRVAFRLGLTRAQRPEKIEAELSALVPISDWIMFSHWLIFHGRQICKARKPLCERCVLEGLCPKRGVG